MVAQVETIIAHSRQARLDLREYSDSDDDFCLQEAFEKSLKRNKKILHSNVKLVVK